GPAQGVRSRARRRAGHGGLLAPGLRGDVRHGPHGRARHQPRLPVRDVRLQGRGLRARPRALPPARGDPRARVPGGSGDGAGAGAGAVRPLRVGCAAGPRQQGLPHPQRGHGAPPRPEHRRAGPCGARRDRARAGRRAGRGPRARGARPGQGPAGARPLPDHRAAGRPAHGQGHARPAGPAGHHRGGAARARL
ncbi:MAG: Transcriptional regulator, AcrR family, partial [uncultured Solirubrobacteraceae bacterium]